MNVHLVVCIHGLWGNPDNLAELARVVRERHPDHDPAYPVDVLVTTSNADSRTYDGVDWGAERVADEVQAHIAALEADGRSVTRFSLVGYSLGGLVARYLLGILHTRGFFEHVMPYNFITVSTPHIGVPKYPGLIPALFSLFGPRLLSRTGKQLYLADQWSFSQRPLLQVMADHDGIFFKTLAQFPHIHIYANAVNDRTVPYLTGAIESEDPFVSQRGLKIDLDKNYGPIIKSITPPGSSPAPPRPPLFSAAFLRSLKPRLPVLFIPVPPYLQLFIWILSPVLLPLLIIYVIVRLSLESRASRARIDDLQRGDSSQGTLINTFRTLEKRTDEAVTALVSASTTSKTPPPRSGPSLTAIQSSLVGSLNALPQMRKHLAYFEGVLNTHGVIVCRNPQKVEVHKRGEGVLRHIADTLVI